MVVDESERSALVAGLCAQGGYSVHAGGSRGLDEDCTDIVPLRARAEPDWHDPMRALSQGCRDPNLCKDDRITGTLHRDGGGGNRTDCGDGGQLSEGMRESQRLAAERGDEDTTRAAERK